MRVSKIISDLFRLNKAGDVSLELRTRLFGVVFWVTAVMMLLGFFLWGPLMEASIMQRVIQAGGLVMLGVVWGLWKWNKVDQAALLLVAGFWILITAAVIIQGDEGAYWLVPQVLLVIFTRFVINGRIAISLGLVTALADFAIFTYYPGRYLPDEFSQLFSENEWGPIFLSFLSILFIFYLVDMIIFETLRSARSIESRYRSLFDKTNDAVFIVDPNQRVLDVNHLAAELLGYTPDQMIGKPYADFIAPEEKQKVQDNFRRLDHDGMSPLFERVMVRKDGSRCNVEFNATAFRDEQGRLLYYQGVARDLTERKRLEEQLRYSLEEMETLAMQDPLTGLLNRRAITEHAEAEWHRSARERRPMCLVLIDLDNLKDVNDSLGHQVGDQAIIELAAVIKASRRRYDWSGRWGGDEFMLVLPSANLVEAHDVAERLRAQYTESPVIAGMPERVRPHLSAGVACYSGRPGEEVPLTQLITQADQAIYRAKQVGKNRVEVYRDEK